MSPRILRHNYDVWADSWHREDLRDLWPLVAASIVVAIIAGLLAR